MSKLSLLAVVAVTVLAGGAALAKEKAQEAPKEKKICKVTKTSSSRIASKKVCRTAAEWAQQSNQEDLEDAEGRLRGMTRGN